MVAASVAAADTAVAVADARAPDLPLVWVNAAFAASSGYPVDQLIGRNARQLQGPGTDRAAVADLAAALRAGRAARARLLNYRPDGTTWWNDMHVSPVRDPTGAVTHWLGLQHDITDRVALEEQIAHAATHDPLTGLGNRASFTAQLDHELARSTRDHRSVAVLFFDVDRFKSVNDTHGHAAGDRLLVQIAHRLTTRLRGEDVVARLGGDEFLAMVVDLPPTGAGAAATVVADLTTALSPPFDVNGVGHRLTVSVGTALHPADGTTAAQLIAAADQAMYRAKAARHHAGDRGRP